MSKIKDAAARDTLYELTGLRYLKNDPKNLVVGGKTIHIVTLLVCAIWWGIFDVSWVTNLVLGGIGTQLVCIIIVILINFCTSCCMAELISMFPLSGGIVGFGRFAFGHTLGFLCGVIECVTLGLTVVLGTAFWSHYMANILGVDKTIAFYLSVCCYFMSSTVLCLGGRFMWNFTVLCASLMGILVLLFLISAMIHGDFQANAFQLNVPTDDVPVPDRIESKQWFVGGMDAFYYILPNTFWFFGGVECTGVAGEEIEDAEASVPRGVMIGVIISYTMYAFVLVAGASLPPGIGSLSVNKYPLADGLHLLFPQLSTTVVVGLASIGALSTVTPWLYAFNRQVFAMGRKGFLPGFLANVYKGLPYSSLIACCIVGIGLNCLIEFNGSDVIYHIIFDIALLATIMVYFWICCTYLFIRLNNDKMYRKFRSPLGYFGAIVGCLSYMTIFVFYCIATKDTIANSIYSLIVLHMLWMAYYYFVSRHYLVLDSDEKVVIVDMLNLDNMLKTEHGFAYLEQHCTQELNPESLYCVRDARELMRLLRYNELTLALFCAFCDEYIYPNSDTQVNVSAVLVNKFVNLVKSENDKRSPVAPTKRKSDSKLKAVAKMAVVMGNMARSNQTAPAAPEHMNLVPQVTEIKGTAALRPAEEVESRAGDIPSAVPSIVRVGSALVHQMSHTLASVKRSIDRMSSRMFEAVIHKKNDTPGGKTANMFSSRIGLIPFSSSKVEKVSDFGEIDELLDELVNELKRIIESDILPRWKKKKAVVDQYLNNDPITASAIRSSTPARW